MFSVCSIEINVNPNFCNCLCVYEYLGLLLLVETFTLIRAAGGVYDFRNFEDVYLCNSLSSELKNSCIPRKTSREYILLSTF
jgi:hypothetical protein